jgi:YD repeat-containing protein
MKKNLVLVLFTALVAIVGCKKDDDKPGNNGGGNAKLVKRIIETEDGETSTFNLTYDGNKRLTSYKKSDNSESTTITYDGAGNVTKIENMEVDSKNEFVFTYNNGVPVSGVFKSWEMNGGQQGELSITYTLDYTVANGLVTEINMTMEDPEGEDDPIEIAYELTYSNGNLTKIKTKGSNASTTTFTYGNKKPVLPTCFKYVLDQGGLSAQFFAKNDLLSTVHDNPGTDLDFTITNQYTYDSDGYVLTSTDGDSQTRFEY